MSCFHTEVINLLDVPTASQKSDEGEKDTQPEVHFAASDQVNSSSQKAEFSTSGGAQSNVGEDATIPEASATFSEGGENEQPEVGSHNYFLLFCQLFCLLVGLTGTVSAMFATVFAFAAGCFKFFKKHIFVFISWTSAAMQTMTSATRNTLEQYKPWFRFQTMHGNLPRALMVGALALLFLSILLSGAQALQTNIGKPTVHINASKSLLTKQNISPTLSQSAAEAMLNFEEGNWLFADQRLDLEVIVATTRGEEREWSLEWILDSGVPFLQ